MMWLSSDHTDGTAGPRRRSPTGDLAVGKIVEEISHSKYGKDSAIFVVEDDSQNGPATLGKSGAAAKKVNAESAKHSTVPQSQRKNAKAWEQWSNKQHLTGNGAVPDYAHPEQLNRYTWYQTHSWKKPYPGDSTIYAPDDVPGGSIPGVDADN